VKWRLRHGLCADAIFLFTSAWGIIGQIRSTPGHSNSHGLDRRRNTERKTRRAFGMIGVAFGLAFILRPGIGGPLGDIDVRLPFCVAAGFSLANWVYGYFFVPESLRDEHRKEFALHRANPIGSLVLLRSHFELWKLASLQFLAYVSHESL